MESDDGVTTITLFPNGNFHFAAQEVSIESTVESQPLDNADCDKDGKGSVTPQFPDSCSNYQPGAIEAQKSELEPVAGKATTGIHSETQDVVAQDSITSSTSEEVAIKKEDQDKVDESNNPKRKVKPSKKRQAEEKKGVPEKKKKKLNVITTEGKKKFSFKYFGDPDAHLFENPIPDGWSRKAVQRQAGASAGKYDTYIYNPSGQKFRSRIEVGAYLAQTNNTLYTMDSFQFTVKQSIGKPVTKVINTKKSEDEAGASNTTNLKRVNHKKIKMAIKKKGSASSTVPRAPGNKDTAASTAILDKLIPSLADSRSLAKSLFPSVSFNKNKRKNVSITDAGNAKRLKIDQNSKLSKTLNSNLVVASTSKVCNPKKKSQFNSQKNTAALQKKKSLVFGPPNRPLLKKTTPSIKIMLKERRKKRKGKVIDTMEDISYTHIDLSEEKRLIKDIAMKNVIVSLIKCDVPCKEFKDEPEEHLTVKVETEDGEKLLDTVSKDKEKMLKTTDIKAEDKSLITDTTTVKSEKITDTVIDSNPVCAVKLPETVNIKKSPLNGQISLLPDMHTNTKTAAEKKKSSEVVTYNKVSPKWIPPQSPYNLIYEKLYSNKWELLVATIIMEASHAKVGTALVWKFLETYPSPEAVKQADQVKLENFLHAVDSPLTCAKKIINFTANFETIPWVYPPKSISIGKYGSDTYKIFFLNEWRSVRPDDYDLCVYHNWLSQNHVILGV